MVLGSLLGSILDDFLWCLHYLFEHRFCTDCASIWKWILICFLCLLTPRPFAHSTCNSFTNHHLYNEFAWFYNFWKMFLITFMIFLDTNFGIDLWCVLASILVAFWYPFGIKFHVVRWSLFFCLMILGWYFIIFWSRRESTKWRWCTLFPHFFAPVPQVVFLKVPWLALAPFWIPFGSMLVVLATLLYQFWIFWI